MINTNMDFPINESYWRDMGIEEKNEFIKQVFQHYRETGFPHYNLSVDEQVEEINKMKKYFESNELVKDDKIKQTMHCLGTAWSYFPHSWSIRCGKSKTPDEIFSSDDLFTKCIERRLKRGSYISDGGIRKALRNYTNVQSVSNFRPSVAKMIYEKYGGHSVYDPCMGFGGRLLGAITSNNVMEYVGCDPSVKTYEGLVKMVKNLSHIKDGFKAELNNCGSEEFVENKKFDLVFTSPPYFDTEKYSDEETQSYKKFPKYELWINGFLKPMIENSISMLKNNGYFIINVANVKTGKNMEEDFKKLVSDFNLTFEKKLDMLLSNIAKGGYKSEPVFIYKKLY